MGKRINKPAFNSARDLTDQQWADIKTRWEMGESMRSVARDYNIALGTIQYHIRKHNWSQELLGMNNKLKADLVDIAKSLTADQKKPVADQIKQQVNVIFDLDTKIKTLQDKAMGVHNIILKKTYEQLQTGDISPIVASRTLQSQGIDVKSVMQTNGLSKEKVPTIQQNTQVNNGNEDNELAVNITLNPV